MNAKDLMLGDWVQQTDPIHNGEPMQVKELRIIHCQDGNDIYLVCDETADVSQELVAPIPLTPEILEKNGFEEDDYYLQYTLYLDKKRAKSRSIVIIPQDNNWDEIDAVIRNGIADINISIRHVHELQHALRLCGIDKEITLP